MLRRFINEEDGATVIEYAFIAVWISAALTGFGFLLLLCGALIKFIVS